MLGFDPNKTYTIGEMYEPAMAITTRKGAAIYRASALHYAMVRFGQTREEAERLLGINLGYFAGYYGAETRARVERLFSCAHPIFGAIAEKGMPTPEEAFTAGVMWAATA